MTRAGRVKSAGGALLVAMLAATAFGAQSADLAAALDEALRRYDLESASSTLAEIRHARAGSSAPQAADLQVRASLVVAELLRIEFEETPENERSARRILGQRIDATAGEALALLASQADTSDNARLRADLIATMIRSDFRAQKYQAEFDGAVARALELDPANPHAWVTSAKPYLFAPPEKGRDLDEAVRRLTKALELASDLEPARLLRAEAYHRLGDGAAAAVDWRAALERNPHCGPARQRLEGRAAEAGR